MTAARNIKLINGLYIERLQDSETDEVTYQSRDPHSESDDYTLVSDEDIINSAKARFGDE